MMSKASAKLNDVDVSNIWRCRAVGNGGMDGCRLAMAICKKAWVDFICSQDYGLGGGARVGGGREV